MFLKQLESLYPLPIFNKFLYFKNTQLVFCTSFACYVNQKRKPLRLLNIKEK